MSNKTGSRDVKWTMAGQYFYKREIPDFCRFYAGHAGEQTVLVSHGTGCSAISRITATGQNFRRSNRLRRCNAENDRPLYPSLSARLEIVQAQTRVGKATPRTNRFKKNGICRTLLNGQNLGPFVPSLLITIAFPPAQASWSLLKDSSGGATFATELKRRVATDLNLCWAVSGEVQH